MVYIEAATGILFAPLIGSSELIQPRTGFDSVMIFMSHQVQLIAEFFRGGGGEFHLIRSIKSIQS